MPKKKKTEQVKQVVKEEDKKRFQEIKANSKDFQDFVKKANKNIENKESIDK